MVVSMRWMVQVIPLGHEFAHKSNFSTKIAPSLRFLLEANANFIELYVFFGYFPLPLPYIIPSAITRSHVSNSTCGRWCGCHPFLLASDMDRGFATVLTKIL